MKGVVIAAVFGCLCSVGYGIGFIVSSTKTTRAILSHPYGGELREWREYGYFETSWAL